MKTLADHPSSFDPELIFNYQLWRLASLASAPLIRLCEGRYGVTRREVIMLVFLGHEGSLSPSKLAQRVGLDRPRTSMAIHKLLEKKLVDRLPAPGDSRRALIALNARGDALIKVLFPQMLEVNERVLAALTPKEQTAFKTMLQKLTAHAGQLNQQLFTDVHADRRTGGARLVNISPEK